METHNFPRRQLPTMSFLMHRGHATPWARLKKKGSGWKKCSKGERRSWNHIKRQLDSTWLNLAAWIFIHLDTSHAVACWSLTNLRKLAAVCEVLAKMTEEWNLTVNVAVHLWWSSLMIVAFSCFAAMTWMVLYIESLVKSCKGAWHKP